MEQTRFVSLIETLLNTIIGFLVTFAGWPIAAALFGIDYTSGQQWGVVAFFSVLSIIRQYVIRRWFNNGLHVSAERIAKKAWPLIYK